MADHHIFPLILLLLPLCSSIDDPEQCSLRDTCSNSSMSSPSIYGDERFIRSRNCFCDSVCGQYGDCCQNYTISTNYDCVDYHSPLSGNNSLLFYPLSVWMRTRCLPSYIGSSADFQCRNLAGDSPDKNPALFVPVTSRQTNITYRNFFCAYCNNDADSNIEFWKYELLGYDDESDHDCTTLKTEHCQKTIIYPHISGPKKKPSVFIRPCKNSHPSTCPPHTSSDLARQCSSSPTAYRYVRNSNFIYRNPYCAQCNEINQSVMTCSDPYIRMAGPPGSQASVYPLSVAFNPNFLIRSLYSDVDRENQSLSDIVYTLKYTCSMKIELYDLSAGKCSIMSNSDRQIILAMKCQYATRTFVSPGYDVIYSNGTLYLVNHSIALTREEYVRIGEHHIVFCGDRLINKESTSVNMPLFPLYRTTIFIVCVSISLACFVLFAIVFWLVPSLHNLPGKCLLLHALSLFIAQVVFIFTADRTEIRSLCLASAVVVHYMYLASFFWLVIIAIDIHSTFTAKTIQRDKISEQRYRLLAYNVLVWCSSGIIVLVASILQFIRPKWRFSPAYGHVLCLISSPHAMILFFLVPLGCLFLIVVFLYMRTIRSIHHSRKMAKLATTTTVSVNSNQSNNSSLVFVYIRLASLMGLQWVLLIIALLIDKPWFWIVFETVNSLPGLFICFGFLCSRRVLNTLKQKISIKFITQRGFRRRSTRTTSILVSAQASSSSSQSKTLPSKKDFNLIRTLLSMIKIFFSSLQKDNKPFTPMKENIPIRCSSLFVKNNGTGVGCFLSNYIGHASFSLLSMKQQNKEGNRSFRFLLFVE